MKSLYLECITAPLKKVFPPIVNMPSVCGCVRKDGISVLWKSLCQQFLGAVVDTVVKIEDAVRRGIGNENIHIIWDALIVFCLPVRNAIAHEHRTTEQ